MNPLITFWRTFETMDKVPMHRQWGENDCEKVSRNRRTTRVMESLLNFYVESKCRGVSKEVRSFRERIPKARSGVVGILCNSVFVRLLNIEEKANNSRRMIHKRRAWERVFSKSFRWKIWLDFSSLVTIGSFTQSAPASPFLEII